MGCGCGKQRPRTAAAATSPSEAFERGVQRSKVMFVVTAAEVESVFYTLREARVFAEGLGLRVETRRMSV